MSNKKSSRFKKGDLVVITHSVDGLCENMIARISCGTKNAKNKVEITIDGKSINFKTKYLDFPNPARFSSKFRNGDSVIVIRHYHRFLLDSKAVIISNYLGNKNSVVIEDERQICGLIPEPFLKPAV